jgi:hypothetical protein
VSTPFPALKPGLLVVTFKVEPLSVLSTTLLMVVRPGLSRFVCDFFVCLSDLSFNLLFFFQSDVQYVGDVTSFTFTSSQLGFAVGITEFQTSVVMKFTGLLFSSLATVCA